MRDIDPEFFEKTSREFSQAQVWMDRAIVLAFALLTGLVVVFFAVVCDWAVELYRSFVHLHPAAAWSTLVITPLITVGCVWFIRRHAPGAAGSGIPQVMRVIEDDLDGEARSRWVSMRLALHKIWLTTAGSLGGLSLGREGPTVHVGASIMNHARRYLSAQSPISSHDLIIAGAAAGIAAAFNTPLGGIVFAMEKLVKKRGINQSTLVIGSIVVAGLVAVAFFGNETYFGRITVDRTVFVGLGPGLCVALACGVVGGLFARLLVMAAKGGRSWFHRTRTQHPLRFAAGCGLLVAAMGLATEGDTAGAGYLTTRHLLEGHAHDVPGLFTLLKFSATLLTAWSGISGGVFAPSLAIGASLGQDVASLFDLVDEHAIPLIALGMAGFLSASTQGPITAFIIVMEMIAGQSMVFSLMACAMVAAGVSRLISGPMYHELAHLLPGNPAPVLPPTTPPPAQRD